MVSTSPKKVVPMPIIEFAPVRPGVWSASIGQTEIAEISQARPRCRYVITPAKGRQLRAGEMSRLEAIKPMLPMLRPDSWGW